MEKKYRFWKVVTGTCSECGNETKTRYAKKIECVNGIWTFPLICYDCRQTYIDGKNLMIVAAETEEKKREIELQPLPFFGIEESEQCIIRRMEMEKVKADRDVKAKAMYQRLSVFVGEQIQAKNGNNEINKAVNDKKVTKIRDKQNHPYTVKA